MLSTQSPLATLATEHPAARSVFMRHRLDFCCGGQRSLDDACAARGLDAQGVAREIEAEEAAQGAPAERWDQAPLEQLLDHILDHYHARLRADLPALIAAADKVERVHGDKPACPRGLAEHLRQVHREVEDHLAKEEQVLFPAVRSGARGASVQMPIRVMMMEHEDHAANLQKTRQLAKDFAAPEEACGTWRALYADLQRVEAELMEHVHLENYVLFPRVLHG